MELVESEIFMETIAFSSFLDLKIKEITLLEDQELINQKLNQISEFRLYYEDLFMQESILCPMYDSVENFQEKLQSWLNLKD